MNIIILENSIAYTGAFKCAMEEAVLFSGKHNFTFVLNTKSSLAGQLTSKGFKVYTLPYLEIKRSIPALLLYPFILLANTIRLRKIVRKEQAGIVQVNDFYNLLGAMLKITGFKGKLITYVRFLPSALPSPLRKVWTWFAQRYSHKVIAVSDAVLNQLPSHNNTIRIYDPVNFTESLPAKNITVKQPVDILYLGNYIQGKGQDYAIKSFAKAIAACADIRIKFAGGDMGLEKNKQFKASLQAEAKSLGIEHLIGFAPFTSAIEQEIKQADILLNFSDAESLSMTVLEAAMYGTPVIATRCGGPEEIIADGETGITVPVRDIDAMAKAITLLANDITLRQQYSAAGKRYVAEKFSTEKYIANFEAVLNS